MIKNPPSWARLFGSVELCDCEHCKSVLGPAAYLVDLLHFLDTLPRNPAGNTPLDVLLARRPDLANIQLTCENTNTPIPYIDLVNEILEYYVLNKGSLVQAAWNMDGTTAEEIAADPQNVSAQAYHVVAGEPYPPTLPYVQPLHATRLYLKHLGSSRAELLNAFQARLPPSDPQQPDPAAAQRATDAEWLELAEIEWEILTGKTLSGAAATHVSADRLHGFDAAVDPNWIQAMQAPGVGVTDLLRRSGLSYLELIALLKTRFVNPGLPHGPDRALLEKIPLDYATLKTLVASGFQNLDPKMVDAIEPSGITLPALEAWVSTNYRNLGGLVVLQSPDLACDLQKTTLQHLDCTPVADADLLRMHHVVRLWRRLGWTLAEVDQALALFATGGTIDDACLGKIATVKRIQADLGGISPSVLLALFGDLDVYGETSAYRTLFLNRAVRSIDPVFDPDAKSSVLTFSEATDQHIASLLAALRITASDLQAIRDDCARSDPPIDTTKLTLGVVSTIYRYAVLARLLGRSPQDLAALRVLCGIKSLAQPSAAELAAIVDASRQIRDAGWTIASLNYLMRHIAGPGPAAPPGLATVVPFALKLRDGLRRIDDENRSREDPDGTFVRERLELLYGRDLADRTVRTILGVDLYTGTKALTGPPPWERPPGATPGRTPIGDPALAARIAYDPKAKRLRLAGILTPDDKTALDQLNASQDAALKDAIQDIHDGPRAAARNLITNVLHGFLVAPVDAEKTLLDTSDVAGKFKYLLDRLLPYARDRLSRNLVGDAVSILLNLPAETSAALLEGIVKSPADITKPILDDFLDLREGAFSEESLQGGVTTKLRRSGWIVPTATEEYTFWLAQPATLTITGIGSDPAQESQLGGSPAPTAQLQAGTPYRVDLELTPATPPTKDALEWKSASTPRQAIEDARIVPAAAIDRAGRALAYLAKVGLVATGFALDAAEAACFARQAFSETRRLFDVASLPDEPGDQAASALFASWRALADYAVVRTALTGPKARIVDFLQASTIAGGQTALCSATGWQKSEVEELAGGFALPAGQAPTIEWLARFARCMRLAKRLGAAPGDLFVWARARTKGLGTAAWLTEVWGPAQAIKRITKAKYDEKDWLAVAKSINDELREAQRSALLAFAALRTGAPFRDANEAFAYFLLDIEMTSAVATSRIAQAIGAVQLFVQYCLLNRETEVKPSAIDKTQWAWMSQYALWRANREVFLYPENWVRPELRKDMSPPFKNAVSRLMQREITPLTVQDAFHGFVAELEQVQRLEICGLYLEDIDPETGRDINRLHVFGRTGFGSPRSYFYRRREAGAWTPWEPVQLDIVGVDDYPGGVHLAPIVWNGRLYLFWPIFTEKARQIKEVQQNAAPALPDKYLEMKIAWSSYENGRWLPKRTSENAIELQIMDNKIWGKDRISVSAVIPSGRELQLTVASAVDIGGTPVSGTDIAAQVDHRYGSVVFVLSPCGLHREPDKVLAYDISAPLTIQPIPGSGKLAMNGFWGETAIKLHLYKGQLSSSGDVTLQNLQDNTNWTELLDRLAPPYRITPTLQHGSFNARAPFFYADRQGTYLVTPTVSSEVIQQLSDPDLVLPTISPPILPMGRVFDPRKDLGRPPTAKVAWISPPSNPWLRAAASLAPPVKGA